MFFKYRLNYNDNIWDLYRFPHESVDSNMYFIPSHKCGIVFDPNENDDILKVFDIYQTQQIVIVLTHEHYDHTSGVVWLQSRIASMLFCHKTCAISISTEKGNDPKTLGKILLIKDMMDNGHRYDDFMASAKSYALFADKTFENNLDLEVGDIKFKCIAAPGHSPGSALYMLGDKFLFSGDSLLKDTPTMLHLPGSDKLAFLKITKPYLQSLSKDIVILPGHGEPFIMDEARFL